MKKTNTRVRSNGGSKSASEQAATPPDSSLASARPMTAQAAVYAIALIDQFNLLKSHANAAGALVLLQADQIKSEMKNCGGWEDLNLQGFNDGANGLAHFAFVRITSVWHSLWKMYEPMIERMRATEGTITIIGGALGNGELALLNALGLRDPDDLSTQLEHAVWRLDELMELQSSALEARGVDSWHLANQTADELGLAYDDFRRAARQFESAVIVLEQARRAERRAA
jgi:hypothetical protein